LKFLKVGFKDVSSEIHRKLVFDPLKGVAATRIYNFLSYLIHCETQGVGKNDL